MKPKLKAQSDVDNFEMYIAMFKQTSYSKFKIMNNAFNPTLEQLVNGVCTN